MSAALAWLVYATVVSLLVGVAALVAEGSAREVGRPGRWIWLAAMAAAVVLPALAFLRPSAGGVPVMPALPVLTLPAVEAAAAPARATLDPVAIALAVWAAVSIGLALVVALSALRLRAARHGWRRAELEGVPVWMTRDLGPAAYGMGRATIVLPAWVFGLEAPARRLLLLHEREHVRAGDPRLLLSGLFVAVAVPWNPVLWWMLARLRLAVEMDCDARVLARAPDARTYGRVLLEVGRRRGGRALVVAFAEPRRFLERRIRRITARRSPLARRRAAVLGALALAPLAVAFAARDPQTAPSTTELLAALGPAPIQAPTGVAYTQEPRLTNPEEVARALQRAYPPLLRDAGIGGTVVLWLFVNEEGRVAKVQVNRSSGYAALDEAAVDLAPVMTFAPARDGARIVQAWASLSLEFVPARPGSVAPPRAREVRPPTVSPRLPGVEVPRTRVPEAQLRSAPLPPPPTTPTDPAVLRSAPAFTPFTKEPRLANQEETRRALQRNYPPLLRDAGIGGKTTVWFFIDEQGSVEKVLLNQSSGHAALDDAALRVAAMMQFTPAENRGRFVPVWVSIPIAFTSK
jgi:TonB family protein